MTKAAPAGLGHLARAHGVMTRYKDAMGEWRSARPEVLEAVLGALGIPAASEAEVQEALRARAHRSGTRPLPRSAVVDPSDGAASIEWHGEPPGNAECRLALEDGGVTEWRTTGSADRSGDGSGGTLEIPADVPHGYHRLTVETTRGVSCVTHLLRAPPTTWRPEASDAPAPAESAGTGTRSWGVFLPLHALRSRSSWGTGDFGDLDRLLEWTGSMGGDLVGTLPLLAAAEESAEDARVYSPVSRLFWNEAYLDMNDLPGLESSLEARRILESEAFRDEVRAVRDANLVDWKRSVELKRAVLEPLARDFLAARPHAPGSFREQNPEAERYARFRARWETRGEPWTEWPASMLDEPLSSGTGGGDPEAGEEGRLAGYHLFVQWLARRQMGALEGRARERGTGLYLDLPVGCDPRGYDVWRHRELFAHGFSVGAPPDDFFSEGQSWGTPPPKPEVMERTGFAYTRACLAHHMRFASRLRLDHVMGLHRLFWVPPDVPAAEGVYMRYPSEALYAVLCIESHRHRCAVVGEDLGTVTREVRRTMNRHRVDRMFVTNFELRSDEDPALPPAPARSVASLNTHDTPTMAGFWKGLDIDRRRDMGLLDPGEARLEHEHRGDIRSSWIRLLESEGDLELEKAPDASEPAAVFEGTIRHLARGPAGVVLVNLEDLWLEERPQNVPGSGSTHPNFRIKAQRDLEEIVSSERIRDVLAGVDHLRSSSLTTGRQSTMTPANASTDSSDSSNTNDTSLLTADDLHLFNEGSHFRLHDKLGSHLVERDGQPGVHFAVWAPNAREVGVMGDFNDWDGGAHPLHARGDSGIWEGFVDGLEHGARYKYRIRSRAGDYEVDKADPFAVRHEEPPRTASVVWDLEYEWGDAGWMAERGDRIAADAPISIYEVHPGSWKRAADEAGGDPRPLDYRELAHALSDHLKRTGFTHVELLPVMEHPFYGSWGYQTTGYFAPTSRYGTPQDLMYLVDHLHQEGFGVILDWVPSHFPGDEHGLAYFDGTHLFEHADAREGFHPDWKSYIFNYGRHEVRSFLISSAIYWLDRYHVDALRVDAVASMLYRDYGREPGEWIPNEHGGRENLEAIGFLRRLNEEVYRTFPDVQTMAEESTAWPMVSRPTYLGGLGFGLKWDMGWMHDTLSYIEKEPVHRSFHHDGLTFRRIYAFSENFVLPLSHDEVVHGKGSLLGKMPGDEWQRFANLRLLLAYQATQPGKKLLFMGCEFGQMREWNHDDSLDWHLLEHAPHEGILRLTSDLNRLYRETGALHEVDFEERGFEWIDSNDRAQSVLSFLRRGDDPDDFVAVVFNFTPVPRENYRLGVPRGGRWTEVLNTDAEAYGGSGVGNLGGTEAAPVPFHGRPHSLVLSLPPLAGLILEPPPPRRSREGRTRVDVE